MPAILTSGIFECAGKKPTVIHKKSQQRSTSTQVKATLFLLSKIFTSTFG
jgi:hypothetical protein